MGAGNFVHIPRDYHPRRRSDGADQEHESEIPRTLLESELRVRSVEKSERVPRARPCCHRVTECRSLSKDTMMSDLQW